MITVCGIYCEKECHAFGDNCPGCHQLKGKVSWTKFINQEVCPIYQCVLDKGFHTCLECNQLPCRLWLVDTKNPATSDEEYAEHLQDRIKNLKALDMEK